MKSRIIILLSVIIVTGVFSATAAELRPAVLDQPAQQATIKANEANNVKFPYVGEITGTEINIRSGPGMNYYSCGKINAPLRVVVTEQQYSWSKILPPQGSFSWIFRQYIQTDANNPATGIVNADNVRVYAGSDEMEPMRCDSVQILLARGQKVRIIGQAIGDYYKIAPPEGATLWAASQYIKYIRSADEIDIKIPQTEPNTSTSVKPGIITEQVKPTSRQVEQYYILEKQFEDEKTKPLDSQDYSKIKAELTALMTDANSGDAGGYAKFLLKAVNRCELAKQSKTEVQEHEAEMNQTLVEIEKERQQKCENLSNAKKYVITGTFKPSLVYETEKGNKRFLIVDSNDTPLCFAEPTDETTDANFADYYGQKVGLVGYVAADSKSNLALVKFERIEKLEQAAMVTDSPDQESTPVPQQPQAQTGDVEKEEKLN
jgi:hypothetical protein